MAVKSKQPRFEDNQAVFGSVLNWMRIAEIQAVPYAADSQPRDKWLQSVWRLEPHLAGVINAVTLLDSSRGWELVGGRNQVARYTNVLRGVEGGEGWRNLSRKASLSYWTTDMGAVTEVGREGRNGPMRSLFHVDPARCRLTGHPDLPLEYTPATGGMQRWKPGDYFRACSLPSDDEAFRGLGYCAVSRALETVRLLYAVLCHDQEQVAARAPKGILVLHNVSEQQWEQSLEAREARMDGLEWRYYGGVQVLASSGAEQVDVKLVALSQLPANFDAKTFTDLCMYTFALCFGYDPSEFWPVQFGSMGRGTETEVQHRKAAGKGGLDFALAYQEQLQQELPETLHFEFEQRDEQGELVSAALDMAKLGVVKAAYEAGLMQGAPLISREEARSLLAEQGLIPEEWTEADEVVTATDTENADSPEQAQPEPAEEPVPAEAERWLELPAVQRSMALWPDEPVVRFAWPSGRQRVIWQRRGKPRFYPAVRRQEDGVLWEDPDGQFTITEADVQQAIEQGRRMLGDEYASLLTAREITPQEAATLGAS